MQFIRTLIASWKRISPRTHLLIGAGAIFLLVVFGLYLTLRPTAPPPERESFEDPELPVSVSSTYADGIHTIEGTVTLRNRCQRLDTFASLDDAQTPALIRLDITSDHDEGICLEIPDTREFSLEVEGPEAARIEIYVNSIPQSGNAL